VRHDQGGLAGGPRKPVVVVHMPPVPNPEDLSPAERAKVYGPGRYTEHGGAGGHRGAAASRRWRDASGREVVAMKPVPNPEDMSPRERAAVYGHHTGGGAAPRHHVASSAPAHHPAAAKPAPVTAAAKAPPVVAAPKPAVAAAKPPPVITAPPAATPAAAPPVPAAPAKPPMDPKLAKLQAAVGPAATNGATLTVADSVGKGQPGKVTLTLSQDLWATIKREAGKAGLGPNAKKTDISALLTGDGYTITPNGVQTVHLASGEAAKFDWLVTPGAGELGALKAQVDAVLAGAGKPMSFTLAAIEQAVKAAPVEAPKAKTSAFGLPDFLSIPGMKDVNLPVVGKVASKSLVAGLIALIILLILVMVVRGSGAAKEREERRRKFRTLTDYGLNTMEAEPVAETAPAGNYATYAEPATYSPPPPEVHEAPQTNYVNPMIAAAAGAAAGAAVAHAVDEHHDHDGHAEEAHADDAHHGDHAHDAHADAHHDAHHDDHGHDAHADHHEHEHA
jgi:hypothetical protein